MTSKHGQTVEETLEDTIKELRRRKIRITPQRRAILKYLIQTDTHPTVEEIYNALKAENDQVSLATVYNNLRVIVNEGFVHEMKFTDVTSRYDFRGDEHYHIICTECGKIADFELDPIPFIEQEAEKQTGYKIQRLKYEAYGICPSCQAIKDKNTRN